MAEKDIHLLSTGDLSVPLSHTVDGRNIQLDVIPFIRLEEQMNPALIGKIRQFAGEQRTVIFTSRQAVRIVAGVLQKTPDWKIYCINGATKREVQIWWKDIVIVGTGINGAELADKVIAGADGQEILFFCSAQRLDEIPSRLTASRIPFREMHVYRTVSTPSKLQKEYNGILFFSPSAVHSFFTVNDPGEALCFSIGTTTTAALSHYIKIPGRIVTAIRPSKIKLLETAIHSFE